MVVHVVVAWYCVVIDMWNILFTILTIGKVI